MPNNYMTEGIAEYVKTLFPEGFKGVCIDIGAADPIRWSNSWIFEQAGWDTYCIEANPNCIPRLREYRKNVIDCACGSENKEAPLFVFNSMPDVSETAGTGLIDHRLDPKGYARHLEIYSHTVNVKVRTLDWLMENVIKQDHIDILSIDVERNEAEVLKGTDLVRWKPKVIVAEHFDDDPSLEPYIMVLPYKLITRITFNDIYLLGS